MRSFGVERADIDRALTRLRRYGQKEIMATVRQEHRRDVLDFLFGLVQRRNRCRLAARGEHALDEAAAGEQDDALAVPRPSLKWATARRK